MPGQVDEIKNRLDVVDVISEYLRLKQMGQNWKGLCPFHNEKTPSFMASRDKQIWHCFGCNEGGDVISFVQKIEGVEFYDALRVLAKKAGVVLERQDSKVTSQRSKLQEICKLAADHWHEFLMKDSRAAEARTYLKGRGLDGKTVQLFQIGFAPESWDELLGFLKRKGFSEQEVFLAGLAVRKERGAGFYDRFRNRVVFPINDPHGHPIGFTGRTLSNDESAGAKYINTPQTELYNKSVAIFNLDKAKTEIRKANLAIIVEGQMDVVASVQAGVLNVVAVSGTALTAQQVMLLKRFTTNVAIALDADAAGRKAVERSSEVIRQTGAQDMNVKVIVLPHGKDPDECIRKNPEDWKAAITQAKPLMDYYFAQAKREYDLTAAEGKKAAAKFFLDLISKFSNRVEQTHWIQQLSGELNVPDHILWESLPNPANPVPARTPAPVKPPAAPSTMTDKQTAYALGLGLTHAETLPAILESIQPEMVPEGPLRDLYTRLKKYYTDHVTKDSTPFVYQEFSAYLSDTQVGQQLAHKLVLQTEEGFSDFSIQEIQKEAEDIARRIQRSYYEGVKNRLTGEIQQAEAADNQERLEELTNLLTESISQLKTLE